MRRAFAVASIVGVLLGVACSSEPDLEDYADDCNADADCAPVLTGDVCECGCEGAAISRREEPRYRKDRGSCESGCAPSCEPCAASKVACVDRRCVVVD